MTEPAHRPRLLHTRGKPTRSRRDRACALRHHVRSLLDQRDRIRAVLHRRLTRPR